MPDKVRNDLEDDDVISIDSVVADIRRRSNEALVADFLSLNIDHGSTRADLSALKLSALVDSIGTDEE